MSLLDIEIIDFKKYRDNRGYFLNLASIEEASLLDVDKRIIEIKTSFSYAKTFRGLHLQAPPYSQGKLVTVIKGSIIDVIYNPYIKKVIEIPLDENSNKTIYIPPGYAHGFYAREDSLVIYGITENTYHPETEISFSINKIEVEKFNKNEILYISEKDKEGI
jgi:dTDP-4-dehydrorhamnose 3,5-epimerase